MLLTTFPSQENITLSTRLNIQVNPEPSIERVKIDESNDCLIVDNILLNPDEVIEWVVANQDGFFMQERAYPGLILPLNDGLAEPLHAFIRSRMSRALGFLRGNIQFQTQVSLTTLLPGDMTWIQTLPHSDPRLEPGRANYATVLYLFRDATLGGTGFYRWRDAAFWQGMTARQVDDPEAGMDELRQRFEMFRGPWAYTTASNEAVELLASIPARFNRLICYSGDIPHNAYVTEPGRLVNDPAAGRLTLNSFASVWPRG